MFKKGYDIIFSSRPVIYYDALQHSMLLGRYENAYVVHIEFKMRVARDVRVQKQNSNANIFNHNLKIYVHACKYYLQKYCPFLELTLLLLLIKFLKYLVIYFFYGY